MFEQNLTRFLEKYLIVPKEYKDTDGTISEDWRRLCFLTLIECEIFTPKELLRQAAKDYGIIIPNKYIGESE